MNIKHYIRRAAAALQALNERSRERRESQREKYLRQQAKQVVQVMEFDGELYLCLNGTPLVKEYQIIPTLPTVCDQARETWVNYMMK